VIVVYGATGFTGTLIAERLLEVGADIILSGRDGKRLDVLAQNLGGEIETRVAHVHDDASLAAAFNGASMVINCAGPFIRLGEPVVRAAIDSGIHYIDTTGEQAFMRDIYERYESRARKAGVVVINGCAFEIAVGDWAAAVAAQEVRKDDQIVDDVVIGYAVDSMHPSAGTQLSALEAMKAPGCVWRDDRWESIAPAAEVRTLRFPAPFGIRETISFPSGEVISVPRHTHARNVQTYISLLGGAPWEGLATKALSLFGAALPALLSSPLGSVAKSRIASGDRSDPSDRSRTRFSIVAEATQSFRRARVAITGSDVYGLTAVIAVRAAPALTRDEAPVPHPHAGVRAPSEVFDAETELESLIELHDLEVNRA
jgi:short subunit dehydrogenase-like uncharacterized protein